MTRDDTGPAPDPGPVRPRRFPTPVAIQAAAAGAAGAVLFLAARLVVLVALFTSPQAAVAALGVLWLLQIGVLRGARRALGSPLPAVRRVGPDGLISGVAIVVAGLVGWELTRSGGSSGTDGLLTALVDGACLGLGTLIADGRRTDRLAALGLGAIGAGTIWIAVLTPAAEPYRPPPAPGLSQVLPPVAADPRPPIPPASPTAEPTFAPVEATIACTTGTLTWSTTGWDAASGTGAVGVTATNPGPRPCYVDGYADVRLAQGGRPLQLTVEQGNADDPSLGGGPRRFGIAPGGAASFTLLWWGHIAPIDTTTPQSLQVALPTGTGWAEVALGTPVAPFDLADGGTIEVGSWVPARR